MELTEEHISKLNKYIDDFWGADYEGWEEIVQQFLSSFNSTWPDIKDFNEISLMVLTVCLPLVILDCSNIFLAYLPVPLWQSKASDREICWHNPKSDG